MQQRQAQAQLQAQAQSQIGQPMNGQMNHNSQINTPFMNQSNSSNANQINGNGTPLMSTGQNPPVNQTQAQSRQLNARTQLQTNLPLLALNADMIRQHVVHQQMHHGNEGNSFK